MDPGRRALIAVLAAAGCGGAAGGGPPGPDAAIPECAEGSAVIGRCRVAGTGADCTGVPGEERAFVPLSPGDEVPVVVGPQGSRMFVLALRTWGIDPGDPDDPTAEGNPDVAITLAHGAALMARYRGRPGFAPAADDPDLLEVAGLFVVVDAGGDDLDGMELQAVAEIEDAAGVRRCGSIGFVAAW